MLHQGLPVTQMSSEVTDQQSRKANMLWGRGHWFTPVPCVRSNCKTKEEERKIQSFYCLVSEMFLSANMDKKS